MRRTKNSQRVIGIIGARKSTERKVPKSALAQVLDRKPDHPLVIRLDQRQAEVGQQSAHIDRRHTHLPDRIGQFVIFDARNDRRRPAILSATPAEDPKRGAPDGRRTMSHARAHNAQSLGAIRARKRRCEDSMIKATFRRDVVLGDRFMAAFPGAGKHQ